MPRFDYRCPDCAHMEFDVRVPLHPAASVAPPLCPACGAPLVKCPAAPAFTIKGYNARTGYTTKD